MLHHLHFNRIILCLFLFECNKPQSVSLHPKTLNDIRELAEISELLAISDSSNQNKLILRISSADTDLVKSILTTKWKLITHSMQDPGAIESVMDDEFINSSQSKTQSHLRIELIKENLKPEVVGFYIENIDPQSASKFKSKDRHITTEMISQYPAFGGYLHICIPEEQYYNKLFINVITIDDPSVEQKSGYFMQSQNNKFISLGFSDHHGISHDWRVIVTHDYNILPVICWMYDRNIP